MDKILISISNTEKYKILLREMKCINKEIHLVHVLEALKLSPDSNISGFANHRVSIHFNSASVARI